MSLTTPISFGSFRVVTVGRDCSESENNRQTCSLVELRVKGNKAGTAYRTELFLGFPQEYVFDLKDKNQEEQLKQNFKKEGFSVDCNRISTNRSGEDSYTRGNKISLWS